MTVAKMVQHETYRDSWDNSITAIKQGKSLKTIIKFLNAAYEYDKIKEDTKNNPEYNSAFRLLNFFRAFSKYLEDLGTKDKSRIKFNNDVAFRKKVYTYLATNYDYSIQNPIPDTDFIRLFNRLGANTKRLEIQVPIIFAKWILENRQSLDKTNLEKYGASLSIMVLLGSTIEGILLTNRKIRSYYVKTYGKKAKFQFNKLRPAYLQAYKYPNPEIEVGLFIIQHSRNLIHPDRRFNKYKGIYYDLNFATYVYRIGLDVIIRLLNRRSSALTRKKVVK